MEKAREKQQSDLTENQEQYLDSLKKSASMTSRKETLPILLKMKTQLLQNTINVSVNKSLILRNHLIISFIANVLSRLINSFLLPLLEKRFMLNYCNQLSAERNPVNLGLRFEGGRI